MRPPSAAGLALVAGVACCGALATPARADVAAPTSSAPPAPSLVWTAAPGCLDSGAARAALRQVFAGREPVSRDVSDVRVTVEAAPEGGWRARIVTRGRIHAGDREIRGASCSVVSQAAVLIVAMTLDPVGVVEHGGAPAPPPAADGTSLTLGASAAFDVGSVPSPTAGVGFVLGVDGPPIGVELRGTAWLPRVAFSRLTPTEGGEIGLYVGAVVGCLDLVLLFVESYRLGACLGPEIGVSTGRGVGIRSPSAPSGLWTAALAGLTLRPIQRTPLSVWFSIELGLPIRRPAYTLGGGDTVFQASPVIGRAAVTVGWRSP